MGESGWSGRLSHMEQGRALHLGTALELGLLMVMVERGCICIRRRCF